MFSKKMQALYLFVQSYQIHCCCHLQSLCSWHTKEQQIGSIFTDNHWYNFPVKSQNIQIPYVWKVLFLSLKCHLHEVAEI